MAARHRTLPFLLVRPGLASDSTHLKVFRQTHSGNSETETYVVRDFGPPPLSLILNANLKWIRIRIEGFSTFKKQTKFEYIHIYMNILYKYIMMNVKT